MMICNLLIKWVERLCDKEIKGKKTEKKQQKNQRKIKEKYNQGCS
jgi:hypothetical protein